MELFSQIFEKIKLVIENPVFSDAVDVLFSIGFAVFFLQLFYLVLSHLIDKSSTLLRVTKYISGTSILDKIGEKLWRKVLDITANSILKRQKSEPNKSNVLDSTIVGMIIGKKAKQNALAYLCLVGSLFVYKTSSHIFEFEMNNLVVLFIFVLLIALYLNRKILEIRVANGLYGNNEYEAREIINFILNHSQKSDFSGGEGLKKELFDLNTVSESEAVRDGNLGGVPAKV